MSTALELAKACVPEAESELPLEPVGRAVLVGAATDIIQAALDEARRKALEECSEIARLQANYAPKIFADKALQTTYELACSQASDSIRALLSESKT